MGRIRDAWHALTGRKAAAGALGYGSGYGGGPATVDAFGSRRAPSPARLVEAYKSIIYACVERNATAVVRVPLRLYAATGKGQARPRCAHRPVTRAARDRLAAVPRLTRSVAGADAVDEVTEHPLLDALDRPNPFFDRHQLLGYVLRCLDVMGSAFVRPVDGGLGPPAELWPLQAQYVQPVRLGRSALVDRWTYFAESYRPDQLWWFRHVSTKDPYGPGYSPTLAALEYARLEDKFVSIQDQVFGLGLRPGGIVGPSDPKMPFGDPERKRLEAELNGKSAGANAGRWVVANGGYTMTPMTYPPADLAGKEIGLYDLERMANCFGVPLPYLTGETNLANLQAAHRQHAEQGVGPRCDLVASVLTSEARKLDPRLFFAFDSCLAEDRESKAKVVDVQVKNGTLTANEARADDGREPVPWGDEPWLPSTLRQPSEERPQPPAQAPPGAAADAKPGPAEEAQDGAEKPPEEKALEAALTRVLARIEAKLGEDDHPGPGHRDGGAGRPPGEAQAQARSAPPAGGEHVRPAGWDADLGQAEGVLQGAGEGRPGDAAGPAVGPPAGVVPPADGLGRPDGGGDDAAAAGLLGGGGQEDQGPPGG